MLYYKEGTIPNFRPTKLRLEDGLTLTDFDDELLFSFGWKIAPPYPEYDYPNSLEWSGTDWVVVAPNQAQVDAKWESVRQQALKRLADTDYKIIKAVEATVLNGTTLDQELPLSYIEYRQALRDIYNNVNNLDPFFVQWPTLQETTNGDQLS